jgi:hypothetical protein
MNPVSGLLAWKAACQMNFLVKQVTGLMQGLLMWKSSG